MTKNFLYNRGDLVIFNEFGNFGDTNDRLFHIHSVRYGTCTNVPEKQNWYSGYLLEMKKYESEGVKVAPVFSTTLTNAKESSLKGLENLVIKDD